MRIIIWFICILSLFSCKNKENATSQEIKGVTNIQFSETVHDFGKLTEGETVSHIFTFKNTGSVPLIIRKVEVGCGCTQVNFNEKPIPPGESGKIEVLFNSSERYGKQYKEILIFANISKEYISLSITADVR